MNTQDQELGVAIWLASHTKLSAKQIHSLCPSVHEFKVILLQSKSCNLAIDPIDPIEEGILTQEDLDHMTEPARMMKRTISKRYVPRILRHYVPSAIAWLKLHHPTLSDIAVANALGTTSKRVREIVGDESVQPINPIAVQILNEQAMRDLLNSKA